MKNSLLLLLLVFVIGIQNSYAQSCSAHVTIVLATKTGGMWLPPQTIQIKNRFAHHNMTVHNPPSPL
ncbi:MAG: hypothetical protein RL106_909, partial [Bacteroidota bacterium]